MVKLAKKSKVGLSPGSLIYVGERKVEQVSIEIINYNEAGYTIHTPEKIEDALLFVDKSMVAWLNLTGLHDTETIAKIGDYFQIHPLIVEDILNTDHRAKTEITDNSVFVVVKMIRFEGKKLELDIEQVSFILGPNYVLSFQEKEGDVFNPIRDRIKSGKGWIRKKGSDYLLFALLDIIVDHYFIVLEKLEEKIEKLEEKVFLYPRPEHLREIHKLKREMIVLRKSIWPLREMISGLIREEIEHISEPTIPFFRDVYDHTIHVIDTVEAFRDTVSGLQDGYLSAISNRTNEVMKTLTIIATIFIPLTFIAGIYGMNFQYMPELRWRWSYMGIWLVFVLIIVLMLGYFNKKKWL